MTQWLECLLHKNEGKSLDLQNLCKGKMGVVTDLRKMKRDSQSQEASGADHVGELDWAWLRDPASPIKE